VEQNHYYPFGLRHTNYSGGKMQVVKEQELKRMAPTPEELLSYKYKYNGKEWQDELGLNMYDYGAMLYDPALGRRNNVDPLAEKSRRWSPYSYCYNNPLRCVDPDGMSPQDIIYFNLNGKEVKRVAQEGADVKKMVLTTSKNETKVATAINNGFVVSAFSNSESDKMAEIFEFGQSDKTQTEKGFMRGTNGESKIVTGDKAGEIGPKQWQEAKEDLAAKGSTPTSDVHLHVNVFDTDGNMISYGLPEGSPTDVLPNNNRGYSEPSVALGYEEDVQSLPTTQLGGTPQVNYQPKVGFYDTKNNPIITILFSDLQNAINKINAQ
jgi:RHS repeat-associated protein